MVIWKVRCSHKHILVKNSIGDRLMEVLLSDQDMNIKPSSKIQLERNNRRSMAGIMDRMGQGSWPPGSTYFMCNSRLQQVTASYSKSKNK